MTSLITWLRIKSKSQEAIAHTDAEICAQTGLKPRSLRNALRHHEAQGFIRRQRINRDGVRRLIFIIDTREVNKTLAGQQEVNKIVPLYATNDKIPPLPRSAASLPPPHSITKRDIDLNPPKGSLSSGPQRSPAHRRMGKKERIRQALTRMNGPKRYGRHVWLREEEHKKLIEDYGEVLVTETIEEVDLRCEDPHQKPVGYPGGLLKVWLKRRLTHPRPAWVVPPHVHKGDLEALERLKNQRSLTKGVITLTDKIVEIWAISGEIHRIEIKDHGFRMKLEAALRQTRTPTDLIKEIIEGYAQVEKACDPRQALYAQLVENWSSEAPYSIQDGCICWGMGLLFFSHSPTDASFLDDIKVMQEYTKSAVHVA